MTGDEKHAYVAPSTLDVLWVLYDRVLNVDPANPDKRDRDRFLLSKGHGPIAYYAVLAAKGFFSVDELANFGSHNSILGQYPDRTLVPGVEISSGSLGHGLPIAVGLAHGLQFTEPGSRVFRLLGDAEFDEGSNEGSNKEAVEVAARLGLGNLIVIVIDNQSTSHGWPGGIASRFEIEGWSAATVEGRDHEDIETAINDRQADKPHAIVARA
jgi:transketolase